MADIHMINEEKKRKSIIQGLVIDHADSTGCLCIEIFRFTLQFLSETKEKGMKSCSAI